MSGVRRVDGWIKRDEEGWPRIVCDKRQLARAAYELMVEQFADKPTRPTLWQWLGRKFRRKKSKGVRP